MQSQAERDAAAVKKLRAAVDAIADAVKLVELDSEERAAVLAAVDVFGVHITRRAPRSA
jgi:hypothetical protein